MRESNSAIYARTLNPFALAHPLSLIRSLHSAHQHVPITAAHGPKFEFALSHLAQAQIYKFNSEPIKAREVWAIIQPSLPLSLSIRRFKEEVRCAKRHVCGRTDSLSLSLSCFLLTADDTPESTLWSDLTRSSSLHN